MYYAWSFVRCFFYEGIEPVDYGCPLVSAASKPSEMVDAYRCSLFMYSKAVSAWLEDLIKWGWDVCSALKFRWKLFASLVSRVVVHCQVEQCRFERQRSLCQTVCYDQSTRLQLHSPDMTSSNISTRLQEQILAIRGSRLARFCGGDGLAAQLRSTVRGAGFHRYAPCQFDVQPDVKR